MLALDLPDNGLAGALASPSGVPGVSLRSSCRRDHASELSGV